MKNKIAVYTCITGDYDNLKEINYMEENVDYFCFTNNKNITSKTWKVIYIEDEQLSNVKLARKIKCLGHPIINKKYDILVWMDGAVVFKKKIADFVNMYLKENDVIAAFKHNSRTTIKEEAEACFLAKKETKTNINKLMKFYEKEKYPDNNGLIESTVFIRRTGNKQLNKTMNLWFDMIFNFTKRDQLSFNYCIYKTGLKVHWINENVFNNSWFDWKAHNNNDKSYKIYLDYGDGFSESNVIIKKYQTIGKKSRVDVEIPNGVKNIRFDPTAQEFMHGKNLNIHNISRDKYYFNNIIVNKNYIYFINDDPNIVIESNKKINKLVIDIEIYENDDKINRSIISILDKERLQQNEKITELYNKINFLNYTINQMYNSKSYKFSRFMSNLLRKICLKGGKK